MLVDLTLLG